MQRLSGLALGEAFYQEGARPILESNFPSLKYSAALIGWSSEVLGYDDITSTDHNWGPRFQLFLSQPDYERHSIAITKTLSDQLPLGFRGHPTNFGISVLGDQRAMERTEAGPVKHKVDVDTLEDFFARYLGLDINSEPTTADWLTFQEHKLLSVTSGKVFHDGLERLMPLRQKLRYYPEDVWLYILAAQWAKIAEEEAFVGRAGEVGDELGSKIIATRQVKALMHLCFMMEQRYAPYSKWFGTAFAHLQSGPMLAPMLDSVLSASNCKEREQHLARAYEAVAKLHNELRITEALEEQATLHGRPYLIIHAERFAEKIRECIKDEGLKRLTIPEGSVNQLIDSPQQLSHPQLGRKLKNLYQ